MATIISVKYLSVLVIILINQGNCLKCWRCSSDASGAAFCHDPFEPDLVNETQKRWSYVDCSFPPTASAYNQQPQGNTRPVCKKMKQIINDKMVVSRSCSWEDISAPIDACLRQNTPSYIKTEFCETCTLDGCNVAIGNGPAMLPILFFLLISKFLL